MSLVDTCKQDIEAENIKTVREMLLGPPGSWVSLELKRFIPDDDDDDEFVGAVASSRRDGDNLAVAGAAAGAAVAVAGVSAAHLEERDFAPQNCDVINKI